jgi:hypothetical protein
MKTDRAKFTSPFPREKTNNTVLSQTKSVYFKNDDQTKLYVEIPISLTKSYMSNNDFYFDLKNWKEQKNPQKIKDRRQQNLIQNRPMSSNSTRKIDSKKELLEKENKKRQMILSNRYRVSVIEKKDIDELLYHDNNMFVKQRILENQKEQSPNKKQSEKHQYSHEKIYSPKAFVDKMCESQYKPFYHKYYGNIPH